MDKGIKLYSRLAWAHDFDNEGLTTATFQLLPGSSFLVNSVKPARDGALVAAGFEDKLMDGWSVLGKFDGAFSSTTAIFRHRHNPESLVSKPQKNQEHFQAK